MLEEAYLGLLSADAEAVRAALEWLHAVPPARLQGRIALEPRDPLRLALGFLRVLDCGGTPIVNPTPEEVAALGVRAVWREQELLERDSGLPADPGTYVSFSSGTTGRRRPLRFDLQRALGNARAHAAPFQLDRSWTIVQTLPVHHVFGLIAYLFTPLVTGARVELGTYFDSLFRRSAPERSLVHLTPYHLQLLARRGVAAPRRIGQLTIGAAPMSRAEASYAAGLCELLHATYGLSEAGPRVTCGRVDPDRFRDGWVGSCLEGVQARVDAQGALFLTTPYACLDTPGELETHDQVERLEDGSLVFRRRLNDRLRIRGQSYDRAEYSRRVSLEMGFPCEIVQRPHTDRLLIVMEGSGSPERVFSELRGAECRTVEEIPRTALGKPDLARLLLS